MAAASEFAAATSSLSALDPASSAETVPAFPTLQSPTFDPALAPTESAIPSSRSGETDRGPGPLMLSIEEARAIREENRKFVEAARLRSPAPTHTAPLDNPEQEENEIMADEKAPEKKSEMPAAKPSAPATAKFKVWAHGNLQHDGKTYAAGAILELPVGFEQTCPAVEPIEG